MDGETNGEMDDSLTDGNTRERKGAANLATLRDRGGLEFHRGRRAVAFLVACSERHAHIGRMWRR